MCETDLYRRHPFCCQVYIVAIDREKESQAAQLCQGKEEDDLDSYEHSGESLLSLVQPELANLSSHWFHALKDHALLSLPPGQWVVGWGKGEEGVLWDIETRVREMV